MKNVPTIPILVYTPATSTPDGMYYVFCKSAIGEKMYFKEQNYEVRDITHFPLGGATLEGYEKYNFPFTRVMLSKIRI